MDIVEDPSISSGSFHNCGLIDKSSLVLTNCPPDCPVSKNEDYCCKTHVRPLNWTKVFRVGARHNWLLTSSWLQQNAFFQHGGPSIQQNSSSKIVLDVYSRNRSPIRTDSLRSKVIAKKRTLLVVHPYLKVGETAKYYLPLKSGLLRYLVTVQHGANGTNVNASEGTDDDEDGQRMSVVNNDAAIAAATIDDTCLHNGILSSSNSTGVLGAGMMDEIINELLESEMLQDSPASPDANRYDVVQNIKQQQQQQETLTFPDHCDVIIPQTLPNIVVPTPTLSSSLVNFPVPSPSAYRPPPTPITSRVNNNAQNEQHQRNVQLHVLKLPKEKGGIELTVRDILTLMPEQFLNDEIMDFWLSHVHKNILKEVDRGRTHLFSIHFYNRLVKVPQGRRLPAFETDDRLSAAEKRHRRVKQWTKNVDIFSKDFVVVPIIDNFHWYVAIICFPGLIGPQWMNNDEPIPDWTNVVKTNGFPGYEVPPGMPKREETKPLQMRVKKLPGANDNQNEASSSSSASKNDTGKVVSTMGTPTPDQKNLAFIRGLQVRDEADEDEDENYLFEQYYCRDYTANNIALKSNQNGHQNINQDQLNDTNSQLEAIKATLCAVNLQEEPMDTEGQVSSADGRTDFRVKQPCIILFDSLAGSSRSRVFTTLREYLQQEYKEKKGRERTFSNVNMPGFMPNVPQQNNLCDCGIYALQYVEHFFSHPLPTFCLPITNLQKWFPELKDKRKEIYDTIYELVKTKDPERLNRMPKFVQSLPPPPTTTVAITPTSSASTTTTTSSSSTTLPTGSVKSSIEETLV